MTEIIFNEDRKVLEKEAENIIEKNIKRILLYKEQVVLGVVGGTSVSGVFNLLRENINIPWNKVHIFIVDERLVSITDEKSNFKLANDSFIESLVSSRLLRKDNVHPFIYDESCADKGTKAYEEEIKAYGGYDVVLLSSGEDGHIGGLYPNHHSVKDDSDFFIFMDDSPKPPPERMSASRNLILHARAGVLMVYGEGKREALMKFIDKDIDYLSCPSKIVNDIEESFLLTDIRV